MNSRIMQNEIIKTALSKVFSGIDDLQAECKEKYNKEFTIDGRFVGDIGEAFAAIHFEIKLHNKQLPDYDGRTSDNKRNVQIKASFKESLTFKNCEGYYLGLKLFKDGSCEEVFNGPAKIISDYYSHRSGIGKKLLSFPIIKLKELSKCVQSAFKVRS